jgi:hypothetical protein
MTAGAGPSGVAVHTGVSTAGSPVAYRWLRHASRVLGRCRAVVAATLGLALVGIALSGAPAGAQPLPFCAPQTGSSVPASGLRAEGGSVTCRTSIVRCPKNAYACTYRLDGEVEATATPGVTPLGVRGPETRAVTGHFDVAGGKSGTGGGSVLASARCTAAAETGLEAFGRHPCGRALVGQEMRYDQFVGQCEAVAGTFASPFVPTTRTSHIEVTRCYMSAEEYLLPSDCARPPRGSLLPPPRPPRGTLLHPRPRGAAARAQTSCRLTERPLRPEPRPSPKPKPPKPPPTNRCPPPNLGGVDVLLEGEFFGNGWATGQVTATSSDGSEPETAAFGYDYVSLAHFGPWTCGTTTSLKAMPDRGSHFDHWVSSDGVCAGSSPACTVLITDTPRQITAFFAPTVYTLSVTNLQPDGRVTSGSGSSGGEVFPGIDCGSAPNGSTVQVFTKCSSGARAQRSDDDATQLFVEADNPGPGGDTYAISSIDGCDRSVATTYPVPDGGGATYTPQVQCFIDMNSDRTITVSYKDVGRF